jgi:hypothetical protein
MLTHEQTTTTEPSVPPDQAADPGYPPIHVKRPVFDGKQFTYAHPLLLFVLESWQPVDGPDVILVLDRIQKYGFAGTMGGRPPRHDGSKPWNPFHGFYGEAPILEPSEADRQAIFFPNSGGLPISVATGKQLKEVGKEDMGDPQDCGGTYTWYFDADTYTIYTCITGFRTIQNRMDAVIRVPRPDSVPSAAV